jgi:hypothetical protein
MQVTWRMLLADWSDLRSSESFQVDIASRKLISL